LRDKRLIRKEILSRRDSIGAELKRAKDMSISERLTALPEFIKAYKILLYASFRSEVDTVDLIKYCITGNKVVVLPKVDRERGELTLYEVKNIEELAEGCFGISEPAVSEDRSMDAADMDVIVVPGVAFDEDCGRLGYGKGFYDKLLSKAKGQGSRVKGVVALAYEEQIAEALPLEAHDIRMDKIITDKRTISCDAG
jgi:5-formyltetrahydrofolate cyclo-ligase